jgi:hypothetical protein
LILPTRTPGQAQTIGLGGAGYDRRARHLGKYRDSMRHFRRFDEQGPERSARHYRFRKGNEWGSHSHWPTDEVLVSAPTIA